MPSSQRRSTQCSECKRWFWHHRAPSQRPLTCGPGCFAAWRSRYRKEHPETYAALTARHVPRLHVVRVRFCLTCGKVMVRAGQRKTCSNACARERIRQQQRGEPLAVRDCDICGREFTPRTACHRHCSRQCGKVSERRKRRVRFGKSWRKKARALGLAYERVDRTVVFKRDGYRCQLCGRKTRGSVPKARAATLDHIIPMASGGPHLYTNVQTACFECNWRKADGAANDQLLLVG